MVKFFVTLIENFFEFSRSLISKNWHSLYDAINKRNRELSVLKIHVLKSHSELLGYKKCNPDSVRSCLNAISSSDDSIWSDENNFYVRSNYIDLANKALAVREKHDDFRNELERSQHTEYLNNAKDRMIAILSYKSPPKEFDPFSEE